MTRKEKDYRIGGFRIPLDAPYLQHLLAIPPGQRSEILRRALEFYFSNGDEIRRLREEDIRQLRDEVAGLRAEVAELRRIIINGSPVLDLGSQRQAGTPESTTASQIHERLKRSGFRNFSFSG